MAETSEKFGFILPSRDGEDLADINQISNNFRLVDERIPSKDDLEEVNKTIENTVFQFDKKIPSGSPFYIEPYITNDREPKSFLLQKGSFVSWIKSRIIHSGGGENILYGNVFFTADVPTLMSISNFSFTANGFKMDIYIGSGYIIDGVEKDFEGQTSHWVYEWTETNTDAETSFEAILYRTDENSGGSGGSITVDQTYNPESENAQSGKAVAEAVDNVYPFVQDKFSDSVMISQTQGVDGIIGKYFLFDEYENIYEETYADNFEVGFNRIVDNNIVDVPVVVGTPVNPNHSTTKCYVDGLVGDIETALDNIIAIQNELIGGGSV